MRQSNSPRGPPRSDNFQGFEFRVDRQSPGLFRELWKWHTPRVSEEPESWLSEAKRPVGCPTTSTLAGLPREKQPQWAMMYDVAAYLSGGVDRLKTIRHTESPADAPHRVFLFLFFF